MHQLARLFKTFALGLMVATASSAWAQSGAVKATHAMPAGKVIDNRYIVLFKPGVSNAAQEANRMVIDAGGQMHFRYTGAVKGFAATLPAEALNILRNNPLVEMIEADRTVLLNQVTSPQASATWGLDRIDQRDLPLNTFYSFKYTGNNVYAFVVDTGIRSDHTEFTGRVVNGYSAISDGRGTQDCNGHGTHVSGTIGGSTYGVAKQVKLVPVRVLDCNGSGSLSGVIAGLDWVTTQTALRPAVANMSLGSTVSTSVNSAVAKTTQAGVTVVVAAGNSTDDACLYSPSSEPSAITVAASTSSDARAYFSNYGRCVDVFAPGLNITSAWIKNSSDTNTISGTSMASPHVAGTAALALEATPGATPGDVANFIVAQASPNRITDAGASSPNLLVYSLGNGAPPTAPVQTVQGSIVSTKSQKSGKNWVVTVTVSVTNVSTGGAVASATVFGNFTGGATLNCVTTTSGTCSISSGTLTSANTVFNLTNVTGNNLVFNGATSSSNVIYKP